MTSSRPAWDVVKIIIDKSAGLDLDISTTEHLEVLLELRMV
jgi:hypothetical protein